MYMYLFILPGLVSVGAVGLLSGLLLKPSLHFRKLLVKPERTVRIIVLSIILNDIHTMYRSFLSLISFFFILSLSCEESQSEALLGSLVVEGSSCSKGLENVTTRRGRFPCPVPIPESTLLDPELTSFEA